MNELKKADEIVRALRDYASECDDAETCRQCTFAWMCDECGGNAPKIIADLIDSLTAQLAASQRREKAAVEDAKIAGCLTCVRRGVCVTSGRKPCEDWEWRGSLESEKGAADGN